MEGLLRCRDALAGRPDAEPNRTGHEPVPTMTPTDLIRSVSKTNLADDYNLSAERYKTGAVAHTGSYEMVELGEVCEFQN